MKAIGILCLELNKGGAERFAANLSNALVKTGYTVHIMTTNISENEYPLDEKIIRAPVLSNNRNLLRDGFVARNYCKKHKLDVLVAINLYPNFVACLSKIKLRTKIVITERNAPGFLPLSWRTRLLKKCLYHKCDRFVFQTNEARDCYSMSLRDKSVVIPNPVIPDLPVKAYSCRNEIVAVGRLEKQKNYELLIKAFSIVSKKHENYILKIFGQGTFLNQLQDLCIELHIESKVHFLGYRLEVHKEMEKAQIYVLSSDFEGMPNSLMEAMAMGFPVISTDCPTGGPRSLIRNMENGILIPVNDVQALSDGINLLIENEELRQKLGEKALEVREDYSEKNIINKWMFKVLD